MSSPFTRTSQSARTSVTVLQGQSARGSVPARLVSTRESQRLPIVQAVATARREERDATPCTTWLWGCCAARRVGCDACLESRWPSEGGGCCSCFCELLSYAPLVAVVFLNHGSLRSPLAIAGCLLVIGLVAYCLPTIILSKLLLRCLCWILLVPWQLAFSVWTIFFDFCCGSCGLSGTLEASRVRARIQTDVELQQARANAFNGAFSAVRTKQLEALKGFVERSGVPPNAVDAEGRSLLWIAVQVKDEACVTYLLALGANNPLQETANAACVNGWLPAMKHLVARHGLNVNTIFEGGMGLLRLALRNGKMNIVEFLLTTPVSVKEELTEVAFHAIVRQQMPVLMQCVSRGLDVKATGADGSSLLHLAAFKGNVAAVNYLRAKGAIPDIENRAGQSPAQVAILGGHRNIATMLGGVKKKPEGHENEDEEDEEEQPHTSFELRQPTTEELGELHKVQQELHNLEIEQQCVVCCDAARSVVLIPCKHLCVCKDCSKLLKDCPVCRTTIREAFEIFVP